MIRKRRRQSGAELVETSLVVLPLFGLLFILLDVSMVVFLRSTFQEAVREGVRYGITGATNTGMCQDDSIKQVVQKFALGYLKGSAASSMHVHFLNPATLVQADNEPGNIIEVTVENYRYIPLAPYGHNGSTYVWARAFDIMEPYPVTAPCLTVKE